MMETLYIIPARGGSKGVPRKNIKLLKGKPLISYSIEYAKQFTNSENICVSTDDPEIISIVEKEGVKVPFVRPQHLSTDTATSYDVIKHALSFYKKNGIDYDRVVLLQPTSPFRKKEHLEEAFIIYNNEQPDAVVSVCETKSNPYFVLFEEDKEGYLKQTKKSNATRRQDTPSVYEINGSIYVINVNSLKSYDNIKDFGRINKLEMSHYYSVDIDTIEDWMYCEFIIEKNLLS